MESWQRDHIRKNMPKLLDYTKCNVKLLHHLEAVRVFSAEDVSQIKAKPDDYEKASRFYGVVVTRNNGYVELLKALSECRQDGAVSILMQGLPTDLLPKLQVRFQGQDQHLSELLDENDIVELNKKLKALNLTDYIKLILECNSEVIPLLKNTIPNPDILYLPRHLTRRTRVDTKLFAADCKDVFVFCGVSRPRLTHLANCHTATSTQQIESISSRFILLENDSHWKDICDIAKEIPVHLIKFDNETKTYHLTKTSGGSRIINQYLDSKCKKAHFVVHEDDVTTLERETDLCICDLPGMGKSLILANMARKFSKCNPKSITAFISLPDVAQHAKLYTTMGLDNFSLAIEVLTQFLAPSEISRQILFLLLNKRLTGIHIYLDGLDEVPTEFLPVIKEFLKSLKEEGKWIRIHVTARTHMRHELEAALGVITYDIVPFTHDNKIQFLTHFWKNQDPTSNETRLVEFANYCLDKWNEHMADEGEQITGIPLQCRLLAEVYSKQAHRYARESVKLNDIEITETSLLQLYNSYLRIGLGRVEKQIISLNTPPLQSDAEKLLAVEHFHIWQALKLLHPKMADLYAKHYSIHKTLEVVPFETIMGLGYLVPDISEESFSVKFVHRTFAEFFTARFFASILAKSQPANNINKATIKFEKLTIDYFFQEAIRQFIIYRVHITSYWDIFSLYTDIFQFSSYVVMKFINDELYNRSCFNRLVPLAFSNAVSAESCYGMMMSTLVQKFPAVLRVVKFGLTGLSKFKLWRYKRYLSRVEDEFTIHPRQLSLLYISAQSANTAVARELYDILSQTFHLNLYSLHNDGLNITHAPLHVAVKRGDYEVVEHVFQFSTSWDERELLQYVIQKTYFQSINLVQHKTAICQLLSSRNPFGLRKLRAIYPSKAHPCLITWLVQNGMYTGCEDRTHLLIRMARDWRTDELMDLFKLLNTNLNQDATFKEIDFPLFAVLRYCRDPYKLIPSIQWVAEDKYGNTLLHMVIAGNHSQYIIEKCLEDGANVNAKNKFGWTCLHVAATQRNVKIMYYLLDKGASITAKSNTGDTPLHVFFANTRASCIFLKNMGLYNVEYFGFRNEVHSSSLHELVTRIFTLPQNEEVLHLLSDKNAEGQTILHHFLYDSQKNLLMSSETLVLLMGNLQIKVDETDNAGNNLLDAAIKACQNESIIKLLRQKLADGKNYLRNLHKYEFLNELFAKD